MSTTGQLAFRTMTRCEIYEQVLVGGIITLQPFATALPTKSASLDIGDSIEKVMTKASDGRTVVAFTYVNESQPKLTLEYGMAVSDLEGIVHNRRVVVQPNAKGFVYTEFLSHELPVARATDQVGNTVVAQGADSEAELYYIDKESKLPVPLVVVDSATDPATLTDGQIIIGDSMEFLVGPALAAKEVQIQGFVPCVFPNATGLSGRSIGVMSVFCQGVSFDNTARMMRFRNCTRMEGGTVSSEPDRTINLQILPDPTDGTGLGYTQIDVPFSSTF